MYSFLELARVIVGIVFVVAFGLTYLRFLINLPRRSRILFSTAGLLYLSGVLAGELIAAHYAQTYGLESLPFGLSATAKETWEMVGAIPLIYALFDCMKSLSGTEIGIYLTYRPRTRRIVKS
ncbi:MAG TPA: hypothetical protein VHJ19_07620 [Gammaproteobacteria bacterium]|nr:hypothetical protein [Gammaproteobacteria bacterium]